MNIRRALRNAVLNKRISAKKLNLFGGRENDVPTEELSIKIKAMYKMSYPKLFGYHCIDEEYYNKKDPNPVHD
ncbi:MAG: hypothetical protein KF860_08510 [Cyclobacteriaceae bacterium]|nr:hypothetical protein [Cyclobacteriaceae bacterium]